MNWTNVKWICLREIRDQMRDRRTMFTIFVLPLLLYPFLGMAALQVAQFSREHQTPVLLLGVDALPEQPILIEPNGADGSLVRFTRAICPPEEERLLRLHSASVEIPTDRGHLREYAEQQIQSGRFDAVVYFPPDLCAGLTRNRTAVDTSVDSGTEEALAAWTPQPKIFINSANDKSRIARDRVESVLDRWRTLIVNENLRRRNVPAAATEPFRVIATDVARESSRRAALWSKILPFIVLVWAMTGAFYPAVDLCAGEKERGTLETLLCSPAQRLEIVWGKLLTIMSFSLATSFLNLASLGVTGTLVMRQFERQGEAAAQVPIGPPPVSAFLWLLIAMVPLSALFSALSLAVAAFARSSREGQYYLMPLLFATLPLMMLSLMPAAQLDLGTSLIPVTGVTLLLRSLIEGHYGESLRFVAPVIAITGVCCALAIRWAVSQFNNESVLFRESERWGIAVWIRHLRRDRQDTPSLAEGVFCGVLLLLLMRFFAPLVLDVPRNWMSFALTTTVTLVAFVAAPALIMSLMLVRSQRQTLLLSPPGLGNLLKVAGLAVAIHPAGLGVAEIVSKVYPLSPTIEAHLTGLQNIFDGAPNIACVLLVMALVPAVCEELAFRGFILSGMRRLRSKWAAILGSAVFFGATHAFVQQSLTACALGIVLGYVAIQTRSLFPGLLFHFLYNSLSLLLGTVIADSIKHGANWSWLLHGAEDSLLYNWPVVIGSVLVSAMILASFRTRTASPTPCAEPSTSEPACVSVS